MGRCKQPIRPRGYERVCNEFGVLPHTDWQVGGPNQGLGRVYFYVTHLGYKPVYGFADANHYNPAKMSFTKQTDHGIVHIDFIKQDATGSDTA